MEVTAYRVVTGLTQYGEFFLLILCPLPKRPLLEIGNGNLASDIPFHAPDH